MKFVYVDESGDGSSSPHLAFFGLHVDAYRLKKVMRDARNLFKDVEAAYPEPLRELKASRLMNGIGGWRHVDAESRKALFLRLCGFVKESGCHGLAYVLDCNTYVAKRTGSGRPSWASTPWLSSATAIVLMVQAINQKVANNKGLSLLVFDDNRAELPTLSEFLTCSCDSADDYYGRTRRSEPFDHIVDTAFAIKSEHSTLVQVADACAYALRRCAELEMAGQTEAWTGESAFVRQCVASFADRLKFPPKTWVANPACDDATWMRDVSIPKFKQWVAA
jgi:hypothetical protein